MFFFLQLILSLILDCHIAPVDRVPNLTGTQCVWSSLETQSRFWGFPSLYSLTTDYHSAVDPKFAIRVLWTRGVRCYWAPAGPQDWRSLENASANHWPVAVGLSGPGYDHMITLTDITETTVSTIDNSDPNLYEYEWSREDFAKLWNGWLIAIDPEWH